MQEYQSGSREEFLSQLRAGEYDDVVAIYRSNESTSVTGPFNKELVQNLPSSLKYITHNGAGYDNIDVASCTDKGIEVSSTPIAVNEATADGEFFKTLGNEPRSVITRQYLTRPSQYFPHDRRPAKNHSRFYERPKRRLERKELRPRPRPQ